MKLDAQLAYPDAHSTWERHGLNQKSFSSTLESSKKFNIDSIKTYQIYEGHGINTLCKAPNMNMLT